MKRIEAALATLVAARVSGAQSLESEMALIMPAARTLTGPNLAHLAEYAMERRYLDVKTGSSAASFVELANNLLVRA